MTKLTNTDRLIASFEHCQKFGQDKCFFYVGKYTGNGPSVVSALRRRGYTVDKLGQAYYEITAGPAPAPAEQPALNYANHIGYSDVEPYEVVREVSAKIIEVRRMAAQLDPSWKPEMHAGGFAAHCSNQSSQKWIITSDEGAQVIRLHMRKDGCFYYQGSKFRREAAPRKFHDYNF